MSRQQVQTDACSHCASFGLRGTMVSELGDEDRVRCVNCGRGHYRGHTPQPLGGCTECGCVNKCHGHRMARGAHGYNGHRFACAVCANGSWRRRVARPREMRDAS